MATLPCATRIVTLPKNRWRMFPTAWSENGQAMMLWAPRADSPQIVLLLLLLLITMSRHEQKD